MARKGQFAVPGFSISDCKNEGPLAQNREAANVTALLKVGWWAGGMFSSIFAEGLHCSERREGTCLRWLPRNQPPLFRNARTEKRARQRPSLSSSSKPRLCLTTASHNPSCLSLKPFPTFGPVLSVPDRQTGICTSPTACL